MKNLLLIFCITVLSINSVAVAQDDNMVFYLDENATCEPGINVIEEQQRIIIDFSLGCFTSQSVKESDEIRILLKGGINETIKGLPDIQHLAVSVAIPLNGNTTTNIITSEYTDYPNFKIAPTSGDPGIYNSNDGLPPINPTVYSRNAFWPSQNVVAHDPYIWAGTRGQSIHFYPIQYNPVTQILRVFHNIKISIETTNEAGINELTHNVISNPFFNDSEAHFSNPANSRFVNAAVAQEDLSRYLIPSETGNMLVISHPLFKDELLPFIDWKNQKGIACEIVDLSTITNGSNDISQAIRDFVKDYYLTKGLNYLILVGDAMYIPPCIAEKGVSDNMYGYILGDDSYPEILVGRFPSSKIEECRIMIQRTIQYEKNPFISEAYARFIGIGSGLGTGDDGEYDFEHIRNISKQLSTNVYKSVVELYDGSRGEFDQNGNPTSQMVSNELTKGAGALMYIGHGSSNSWVTTGFSTTDIKKLQNKVHPFIWSAGCNNGAFESTTSLAEMFLNAGTDGIPAGAVAALMSSTTQTWYPPMEAQDEIALILGGHKPLNTSNTFGGVSLSGCMKMNDKYGLAGYRTTDTWILFGDPSMELRTALPKNFNPQHPTKIGSDQNSIIVKNIEAGTLICASVNGTILSTVVAQETVATIEINNLNQADKITLTLSAKNYIPYVTEILVTDLPGIAVDPTPGNNTNKNSKTPEFSWNLSEGCTPENYTFQIRRKGTQIWESQTLTSASEIQATILDYSTNYEWRVISSNMNGNAESAVFQFQTIDAPDEDFEQNSFPRNSWINQHDWYVDDSEAFEGIYSLHSGSTATREISSLVYECETISCDYISFVFKTHIQNESSKLAFFIDNFMIAEWDYSTNWTNFTYQVEPGNHQLEWRFSSNDTTGEAAAWLDNIYLPVNLPVEITALSQEACPSNFIMLSTSVSNHASLFWETSGSGSFDDATRADAIYFPSSEDLENDSITLKMNVVANSTCATETYDYVVKLLKFQSIPVVNDTTLYLGETISINRLKNDVKQFLICGNQTYELPLTLDQSILIPGDNTITILLENELGCTTTTEFKVTLINSQRPDSKTLTIFPNPASEKVNIHIPDAPATAQISLFNMEGLLVDCQNINPRNSQSIDINNLKPGFYIIKAEYDGNITTGKLIKI